MNNRAHMALLVIYYKRILCKLARRQYHRTLRYEKKHGHHQYPLDSGQHYPTWFDCNVTRPLP